MGYAQRNRGVPSILGTLAGWGRWRLDGSAMEVLVSSANVPGFELLYDDGSWRVALWKNVLLTGVADAPTGRSLAAVAQGQERLFTVSGAVAGLTVITGMHMGRIQLNEDVRSAIGRMMRVPNLKGHSAIAIETEGFASATVRALLSAVVLLSRPESPQKIFDSRLDGARYLAAHANIGRSVQDLVACADQLTLGLGT